MNIYFKLTLFISFAQLLSSYLNNKNNSIINRINKDFKGEYFSKSLKIKKCSEYLDDINDFFDCILNYNLTILLKNTKIESLNKLYFSFRKKYLDNKNDLIYQSHESSNRYLGEKRDNSYNNEFSVSLNSNIFYNQSVFELLIQFLQMAGDEASNIQYLLYDISYLFLDLFDAPVSCLNLHFDIFNNSVLFDQEITIQLINKMIVDLYSSKNDFLSFDSCLQKSKIRAEVKLKSGILTIEPLYVISMIDDTNNKGIYKNSTLFEKYFFTFGVCFPDLYLNGSSIFSDDGICHGIFYEDIIDLLLNFTNDMTTASIENIYLKDKDDKFSNKEIIGDLIPFVLILIPLLIYIFLILIKNKLIKPKKQGEIYNKLNNDIQKLVEEENDENEEEEDTQNEKRKKVMLLFPKWYKLLKDIFNYGNNVKELFNFSLNNRNINNINGLGYIKGIMGLSILLIIIGYTFFTLYNLPVKYFGIWSFHNSISYFLYFPIFIGLRYSPRIIFSCSGYTLAYKYLSFISQEPDYFFWKFNLLESYKYIILIVIILFVKYSLYHINLFISKNSPSWEIFERKVLKMSESKFKTLMKIITCKINNIKIDHERLSQDIFDYYWMTLNEIFFFIFGTIIISLGYRFKMRIDYFIVFLILFLYIVKIIYYYIYYYNNEKIYTTLYYCLFEYGKLMLNPLFNLPSFLIGMYFGLINYTILRGINFSNDIIAVNKDESNLLILNENSSPKTDQNKEKIIINNFINDNDNNINIGKKRITDLKNNDNKEGLQPDEYRNSINNNQNNEICLLDKRNNKTNNIKNKNKSLDYLKYKFLTKTEKNEDTIFDIDLDEENNEISFDKISLNQSSNELNEMPFLITPSNIVIFIRKNNKNPCFIVILIIFLMLFILFTFINLILIYSISNHKNLENINDKDEFMKRLTLEKVISNFMLNLIYLIDIELIVLFVQFGFFYLYISGHEIINGFFNHIYWSFFSKIYFSFLLVQSPIILFNLYNSETLIKVNIYNIYVYSFINIFLILFFMIICYIYLELPLKKLFKFLIRKYKIEFDENNIKKEEDNEEDDD